MKRVARKEEHDNADRWLLTYADLITLLLGLFVILYAVSKIDGEKYSKMINALGGVFGKEPVGVFQGTKVIVEPELSSLEAERQQIERTIEAAIPVDGSISITQNERGVTVHIMDELLFSSGSAVLKTGALTLLDDLSGVLRQMPHDIRVEGHTDNVPIQTAVFPSNWHLSVARAVNAAHFMVQRCNIAPERVSVVGYSEYRPLLP
ncbi:MAG: OmpA family protein, partial [Ignavibacteria bacterium]|nr:OmpA family protein [Ignavibacteria bacterium]